MYSCETVWVKVLVSKKMDVCSQKLQFKNYNSIVEKNKHGEGGRFKDNEFSGVK